MTRSLVNTISTGGGGGGGTGVGDVDTLALIDSFQNTLNFTTLGSGIDDATFRLTHDSSVVAFAEATVNVTAKFRGKGIDLFVDIDTIAQAGNFKVIITDETNSSAVLTDEVLTPQDADVTSVKRRVSFFTENNTGSIKVRFEALPEAGAPTSDFDDAVLQLALTEKRELSVIEQKVNTYTLNVANNGTTATATGSSPGFQWWDSITRNSQGIVTIDYTSLGLSSIPRIGALALDSSGNRNVTLLSASATSAQFELMQTSAANLLDFDFAVSLTKQGSDYEDLTRKVERELSTFHEVIQEQESFTETKILSSSITAAGDIAELQFSDLEVGEEYIITGVLATIAQNQNSIVYYRNSPNGAGEVYGSWQLRGGTDTAQARSGSPVIFTASSDTLYINYNGDSSLIGDGTRNQTFLQLTKKSKLLKAGVVPDSKIEIPTSELRFEDSTSRGTGSEAYTVKYDNLAKVVGDALAVDNSNGTIITVKKDGFLSVSAALRSASATRTWMFLTKNASDPSTVPLKKEILHHVLLGDNNATNLAGNLSWSGKVRAGDIIRLASQISSSGGVIDSPNYFILNHHESRIQVAISNVKPQFEDADSMVRILGGNGHGSTNTNIRRFSNLIDNIGSDVQYTDSATDGAKFTVLKDGFYTISYMDSSSLGPANMGISLNSTELSTNVNNISDVDVLNQVVTAGANYEGNSSWSGRLKKGDIIRAHTEGSMNATTGANLAQFTIAKVGKPSIAEVDVTPFVNLEQSFTEHNSVNLAGNDGRAISVNTEDIQYNGWDVGWTSEGDNNYYTVQQDNSIISLTTTYSFTTDGVRRPTLYKNGILYRRMNNQTVSNNNYTYGSYVSTKGEFLKGDQISIREGNVAGTLNSAVPDHSHYLNILEQWEKVGRSKFHAVNQTENEFSARIGNGGTASIKTQSQNFISSVNLFAQGEVKVNFVPDFFTTPPSITAITNQNSSVAVIRIRNVTTDGFEAVTQDTSNTTVNVDFDFIASRQGADRKDLQRAIVQLNDFPRVNRTISQSSTYEFISTSVSAANLSNFLQTSSGETSKFYHTENDQLIIDKECFININAYSREVGGDTVSSFAILKNGTRVSEGVDRQANSTSNADYAQKVKVGDIFTFFSHTGNDEAKISVTAFGNELERITNVDKAENEFSARIDNAGAIVSQSSDFIESVTKDGAGLYRITWKPSFFSVAPAVTALNNAYGGSAGISVELIEIADTVDTVVRVFNAANTAIDRGFDLIVQRQGSDYKSIQDVVVAIPPIKTAYIQDVKPENTGGGDFNSGAWQTRDVNTLKGDTGFLSLSGSQIIIQPGKYKARFDVPALGVDNHKARILINGVEEYLGKLARSSAADSVQTDSVVEAQFEVSQESTLDIQHYCGTSRLTDGFGAVGTGTIGDNIFTQGTLVKVG